MGHNWIEVRVASRSMEADNIVSLELVLASGDPLKSFSAGSHIDVELPNGMIRQYSLCNDSSQQHRYQIAVLLDPATRGGSASVHGDIKENQIIRISEPRQHFPLTPAKHSILIAGGIGVTPILCMADHLKSSRADFEMHYCTRSLSATAFAQRIRSSAFSDRVHFHFDDGEPAQKFDIQAVLSAPNSDTHLYVCGPKGFMDFVIDSAKHLGWPDGQIHLEYFAGQSANSLENTNFQVKIFSTGQLFDIPADKSIVASLLENGVEISVSCEEGICGTCVTRVLEGVPDHRDLYFNEEEKEKNDQFTPCCSRSKTPVLVLDL
ncbi:Vanillate O-demethylase oxidoreductase [Pseudomonas fluorescens]|uniref:PDR/VanB family oxidoreductase n=1 Tax=Pseudomonas fluorescens TaxID=294 RepID=UPI00054B1DC0|nr:PDR/VanB family oxidoreductase [Pseudomonas fluorescens]KII27575.1 Vanillate O-demethylase oxidoreductase [Pseudomonas fluorescens]